MIRKQFYPLAAIKALDSYTALDLPRTQTVKDRVKWECDAGFHQTLEKECGKTLYQPQINTDEHTKRVLLSLPNIRLVKL